MDLWLLDSILCGRKVNLGFLIVQNMANILSSAHNVLPYGMPLTIIFRYFDIDLDGESNILICKPSNAINNSSIFHLGYELHGNESVLKTTRVPTAAKGVNDEEATMDIPPPSPTTVLSSFLPTAGARSSSATFDYASALQNLSQGLDTISLDVQQM